jgi:hypothetical protein
MGTFGALFLFDAGVRVASYCTAEEQWLDNQPAVSCIPTGTYVCRPSLWHKHQLETYEVRNVPDRARILIHPGKTVEDTEGCILLGETFGAIRQQWAVLHSREAFAAFMGHLDGVESFPLEVRWSQPGEWRRAA